jgi:hypothetical protein
MKGDHIMKNLVLTANMVATIRKNLIESFTIASGAKSTATYYHNKDEQTKAIKKNVQKLYGLSKELPLIVATQKGVTGKFVSEVLLNEFKNTQRGGACNIVNPIDWYDEGIGDKALLSALYNLNENGIPYVLRLFVEMKAEKVNNERARKIMLGFLLGHSNLEFYSLKYRNKIAEILQHVYGVKRTSILLSIAKKYINTGVYTNDKEANIARDNFLKYTAGDDMRAYKLLLFIFKEDNGVRYLKRDFPVLFEYQKAKTDITGVTKVPEEVLIGLISNENHPQYNELWSTAAKRETTKAMLRTNTKVTSVNQQVRQTKSTAKLGVEKAVDLKKATDFLALYKTGYESGWTDELKQAIDELAEKKKIAGFHYANIGIIEDRSNSMAGHKEQSKNTPKAVANFTARVLSKSAQNAVIVQTEGETTDLSTAFVDLLKRENEETAYNAIFILTDGYENAYEGLMNEVLKVYFAETNRDIPVFQISPITGAETGGNVRKLGENVVTMAINNPVAIQPQINARLLEIDTSRWLENQVHALESANVSRKVTHNINV